MDVSAEVRDRVDVMKHAIETLLADPDGLPRLLQMRAAMRNYSFGNQLLLLLQRPQDNGPFAPASVWAQLGREVRDDEVQHPSLINVPRMFRKKKRDENGKVVKNEDGKPEYEEKQQVTFSLSGKVYSLEQTDGDPLPDPPLTKLAGDAPQAMKDRLVQVAAEENIAVSYEPLRPELGGYYNASTHSIVINANNSDAQQTKTLAHELGHAFDPEIVKVREGLEGGGGPLIDGVNADMHRGRKEAVAEATAYVVAHRFGLDSEAYSHGYVATWTNGKPDELEKVMERVEAACSRLLPPTELETRMESARAAAAKDREARRKAKKATNGKAPATAGA